MKNASLTIFGMPRSTTLEIYEVAKKHYAAVFTRIQMRPFSDKTVRELKARSSAGVQNYIIGVTDYEVRKDCADAVGRLRDWKPFSIISPHAYVADSARLGRGVYIAAHASISTNAAIGDHAVINLNASVGHDAVLRRHVIVLPGARVSGATEIGEGVLLGSNSFVFQGVRVGKGTVVDALTYVHANVGPGMICSSRSTKVFKRIV